MNSVTTLMNCSNPDCSNLVWITVEQKRELKTYHFLKYGKTVDVYCSKKCQEAHLKELSQAEFMLKGTLKNHEFALVVQGADVTTRKKDSEVRLVTGNVRELRARALREKLISIIPRKKRKCMYSIDVQEFLINGVSENLRATETGAKVAAWRTMNKCRELFPMEISIFEINERDRGIEYIK